ncbi:MAG: peptide chain release factor 1 [Burkholderiales bacterium RIFCSPHIGHO2_12_FULL_61_11]|nr:MAG: peptide chain release factor 1 [Burkholderiales bacterium RIFCSPHIGHO2_12_FULL_61_11]
MKPFLRQTLDRQLLRLHELDALLSASDVVSDLARFRALTREHAETSVLAGQYSQFLRREADLLSAENMLIEAKDDPEMAAMAEEEIAAAKADIARLDKALQLMLIPKDPDDVRAAFIEIRAGTGGDESALFAGDLFRMYTRFAERNHWQTEIISESASELGGFKEVVLRIDGPPDATGVGVYGKLRFESGGHRVQRVPVTETQGRIHTSACTVAVLPEPDEAVAILINPADLRIDTYRASGAGGQHINKTDSAVRITHLPTGIVAECQEGRSQHGNKAQALKVLSARIHEKDRSERAAKDAAVRKGLVGSGDRSDRIRTYNFPQGRLTDHRINLTLYKLGLIMDGDLGDVITALQVARGAEQLAELENASASQTPDFHA